MFDVIVVLDWSAASRPVTGPNSIWQATVGADAGGSVLVNHRTRSDAAESLRSTLRDGTGRRVLVGIDASLGYCAGLADALALDVGSVADGAVRAEPWRAVWRLLAELVEDGFDNRNNRFEVAAHLNARLTAGPAPFWGCPSAQAGPTLAPTRPPFPVRCGDRWLAEHRACEAAVRAGGRWVSSTWQTSYAGSVGGQALTAIPVLDGLLEDPEIGPRCEVWPFSSGFADPASSPGDTIIIAEVWPSMIPIDPRLHHVRDAAQVLGMVRHLTEQDASGSLSRWFTPDIDPPAAAIARREEGWILGA
jgi:hypothetical protein